MSTEPMDLSLELPVEEALKNAAAVVETTLEDLLPEAAGPERRLLAAMRYAAMGGGKRFRPFLVMASGDMFGIPPEKSVRVAAALEMVHTYSLVHDDLPCMDDDDLRRGRATTHIEFDEATAVLTGDSLLTLAFEVLADDATHRDARIRCELVRALAQAAGCHGMAGGQMIDLEAEEQELDIGAITRLQQMKTGALIAFAAESGTILSRALDSERQALHAYAHDLGLAFQIADDLLDTEGTADEMGKRVGKDEDQGKATFVSVLGVERARSQADILARQAIIHLDGFGESARLLREVANFVINRRS